MTAPILADDVDAMRDEAREWLHAPGAIGRLAGYVMLLAGSQGIVRADSKKLRAIARAEDTKRRLKECREEQRAYWRMRKRVFRPMPKPITPEEIEESA